MAANAAPRAPVLKQAGRDPAQGLPDFPDVIPGRPRASRANPESRANSKASGFRVRASKSAVADLDNDIAELG
jgi:hypothetical protein